MKLRSGSRRQDADADGGLVGVAVDLDALADVAASAGLDRPPDPGVDGLEALLSSSCQCEGLLGASADGVFPHVPDDHVGELTLVSPAG